MASKRLTRVIRKIEAIDRNVDAFAEHGLDLSDLQEIAETLEETLGSDTIKKIHDKLSRQIEKHHEKMTDRLFELKEEVEMLDDDEDDGEDDDEDEDIEDDDEEEDEDEEPG